MSWHNFLILLSLSLALSLYPLPFDQTMADEIRMTIGQAFEICYQKVMKAKRLSQEKRTSGGSPMTSPVH